jgi:hypothetical protein
MTLKSPTIRLVRAWVARDGRGREVLYHPACAWFCPPGRGGQVRVWTPSASTAARAPATCAWCGRPIEEETR